MTMCEKSGKTTIQNNFIKEHTDSYSKSDCDELITDRGHLFRAQGIRS